MYASRKADEEGQVASGLSLLTKISPGPRSRSEDPVTAESLLDLASARVTEGDDVYGYAHRVLGSLIAIPHPNFPTRIRSANQREGRPVRILSLCSGAAGVERQLIASAECPVEITLFDLNENLMRKAAAALSSVAEV
jgi:hypothetical protein